MRLSLPHLLAGKPRYNFDFVAQARVLYSSATGASEPNNLAYMTRLGTFGYKNMVCMSKV